MPKNSEVETKASPPGTTNTLIVEDQVEVVSEIPAFVVELGIPFELGIGETVRLGESNFDLTFEAIIQDGRCPVGGACVWEGEAEVQFLLSSSNTANTVFTLKILGLVKTPYLDNPFVEQAGFRFKLLQLEPYPTDENPTQLSEYLTLLLVEHSVHTHDLEGF